ncbi:type 4 prepilin-like proteins leader peptide-processing enzyme [Insulibacter thermoxylanivorax]|uniref:Prepilin leader peptidase/N-methyltransferase n=1 Tax=Insulibacter thermoxylanivorax TaxID=2749268 RepID=A0A916Q9N9_9BACL|nr:A24 family peptidase [Insulibacter thermoxylanivorax]GFR36705.1 type 4 prepilin-like proteins leader peptide-processing enzyme [Insulibacter thermoxylanivorax]
MIPVTIGLFFLGLLFGSFFNVVGIRLPAGQSVVSPPSSCPSCGRRLSAKDLIPVVSWLFQRGRCRTCGEPISPLYLLGELATGIGYAALPHLIQDLPELLFAYVFISVMIIITISDLRYQIIPNKIIYPMIVLTLIYRILYHPLPMWEYLSGFAIGGGMLLLVSVIGRWMGKPNAMGGGDVKLMAWIGLAGGLQMILLCIFLSSLIGFLVGVILLWSRKLASTAIPFGPFIAIGACVSLMLHETIFTWYLGLFI